MVKCAKCGKELTDKDSYVWEDKEYCKECFLEVVEGEVHPYFEEGEAG